MTLDGEKDIKARVYPRADVVFSSPLVRCKRTAAIIYPNQEIIIIDELRETNFGRFEGKNYLELAEDEDYKSWIEAGGEEAFPGGESRDEANARIKIGFERLITFSGDNKNISIIAHGGTIMGILSQIFDGEYYSYHVENGEGYTFDLSSNGLYHGLRARSFLR